MPVDVAIPTDLGENHVHGRPSVGIIIDAPVIASVARPDDGEPWVRVAAWHAFTAFGGLRTTWDDLLAGRRIDDHARAPLPANRRRAMQLAHAVAWDIGARRIGSPHAAVIVGTSKGSIEDWLGGPPPPDADPTSGNPTAGGPRASGLGDIAARVATRNGLCGPRLTVSAACASGLLALARGAMMIRRREAAQVLVIATEASVHPLFLGSFQRLGVLAKGGAGCRPFDRDRTGFYVSESAAAVLLEAAEPPARVADEPAGPRPRSRKAARQRRRLMTGRSVYVERFALGGDATHLTGGDPESRVLRHLLARVIDGRPVELIHAHGTGTTLNDATELAAIEHAVGDGLVRPVVYSHKGALGHSLGASGLLSVVLNCQCHATARIPPNAGTTNPLPARRVVIPHGVTKRIVMRSVAVAAGFGGPVAAVGLASR